MTLEEQLKLSLIYVQLQQLVGELNDDRVARVVAYTARVLARSSELDERSSAAEDGDLHL